jgi:hypothetical protein
MKDRLVKWLFEQSPAFIVMAILAYVQFNKQNELEKKVDNCQGAQIELLKTTVEDNTRAFEKFAELIERMK